MARPRELAGVAVPSYKTWHTRTHADVTTERVRSWRQRLSAEEIVQCEAVFGSRLARFGYEPSTRPAPTPAVVASRALLAARDRLGPLRQVIGDARAAARREPAVAARLTSGQVTASRS